MHGSRHVLLLVISVTGYGYIGYADCRRKVVHRHNHTHDRELLAGMIRQYARRHTHKYSVVTGPKFSTLANKRKGEIKISSEIGKFVCFIYFLQTLYMFQVVPFAHHQEHINVHTASGIVKPILLLAAAVEEMKLHLFDRMYSYVLLMMGGETA